MIRNSLGLAAREVLIPEQAGLFAKAVLDHEVADCLNRSIADHQAGRVIDAARGYQQVLGVAPDNLVALNNLSLMLVDHCQAIGLLNRALARSPDYVDALINLGVRLLSSGECLQAYQTLERARALAPEDSRVANALAAVKRELKKVKEA